MRRTDIMDNYRLIEVAKKRAVERANSNTVTYENYDKVGKVEVTPNHQVYMSGYTDYHFESK